MTSMTARAMAAGLLVALTLGGCASRSPEAAATAPATATATPSSRPSPAEPDVRFMTDMIGHHSQAVRIAGWAPSHDASPAVQRLAERIVVGQNDEIALLTRWLRNHGQPVPATDSTHQMHQMHQHQMMPGMLTAEQLAQLDQAKGPEFDRLFLEFMIAHHQGALVMVDQLFGSQGAAQDETVFRLASDVYADQSTEIDRMQKMLAALPTPSH